jgi:hypothetical protein
MTVTALATFASMQSSRQPAGLMYALLWADMIRLQLPHVRRAGPHLSTFSTCATAALREYSHLREHLFGMGGRPSAKRRQKQGLNQDFLPRSALLVAFLVGISTSAVLGRTLLG